jgi:prevent-host-death family protein
MSDMVSVSYAQAHWGEVLKRVVSGEQIVISRRKKPMAMIASLTGVPPRLRNEWSRKPKAPAKRTTRKR